jgi:tetratricopeptide (TPR) repeat protein
MGEAGKRGDPARPASPIGPGLWLAVSAERKMDSAPSGESGSAGAAEHYRAGLAIAERLAAADPTNTEWQRDLSISRSKLGDVAVAAGDLAGAPEHYRAGLAIRERLAAADPTNTGWQRDLSGSRERLGDVAAAAGDLTGAGEHYRAGLAIVRRLTEAQLDVFSPELARSLTSLGVVLTEMGRHDEAQALDRQALTIYLRLHRRQPDRLADDVGNAKRNMVIDLMKFGRTEGETAPRA